MKKVCIAFFLLAVIATATASEKTCPCRCFVGEGKRIKARAQCLKKRFKESCAVDFCRNKRGIRGVYCCDKPEPPTPTPEPPTPTPEPPTPSPTAEPLKCPCKCLRFKGFGRSKKMCKKAKFAGCVVRLCQKQKRGKRFWCCNPRMRK